MTWTVAAGQRADLDSESAKVPATAAAGDDAR